jgi:hypothetical protein
MNKYNLKPKKACKDKKINEPPNGMPVAYCKFYTPTQAEVLPMIFRNKRLRK